MPIDLIPPSGQISEGITVSAGAATLDFVPDPNSISIANYVRMYEGTPMAGQFKVTPGSAVLAFNTANNGASLTVLYNAASAPGVTEDKVNEVIEEVNALEGDSPDAILTTKGDLMGFDTAPARVPVGTDGQVLTADSGAALGVSWQTPATPPTPLAIAAGDSGAPFAYSNALGNTGNITVPTGTAKAVTSAFVSDGVGNALVFLDILPPLVGAFPNTYPGNYIIPTTGGTVLSWKIKAGETGLVDGNNYQIVFQYLY